MRSTNAKSAPSATTTALQVAILVVLLGTPIVTAAYLSWRIRHPAAHPA